MPCFHLYKTNISYYDHINRVYIENKLYASYVRSFSLYFDPNVPEFIHSMNGKKKIRF